MFNRLPPADTRAPRVSATAPAADSSGVPTNSNVTVTFDEPLDPLTVNAGSITLKDGTGSAVVAR